MKTIKITFFISFMLLWAISIFNHNNTVDEPSTVTIQQSPLSDDETNPVSKHISEVAEFDLEDHRETDSFFSFVKVIPFTCNNIYSAVVDYSALNPYRQPSSLSLYRLPQSYLQVFRI